MTVSTSSKRMHSVPKKKRARLKIKPEVIFSDIAHVTSDGRGSEENHTFRNCKNGDIIV